MGYFHLTGENKLQPAFAPGDKECLSPAGVPEQETQQRSARHNNSLRQTSPQGVGPSEATLLLPLTRPESAHQPLWQPSKGPDQDLLLDGSSGIELVVKEALQLPLSFRLQVF